MFREKVPNRSPDDAKCDNRPRQQVGVGDENGMAACVAGFSGGLSQYAHRVAYCDAVLALAASKGDNLAMRMSYTLILAWMRRGEP